MRRVAVLLVLAFALPLYAQSPRYTAVSATVTDANGTVYAGGTGRAVFVPGPGGQQSLFGNGQPFQQTVNITKLDSTGSFSISLADNTRINPSGSQWTFSICAADGSTCFHSTQTVSGTTQSLSSALSAAAPAYYPINVAAIKLGPGGVVFNDNTNMSTAPQTVAGTFPITATGGTVAISGVTAQQGNGAKMQLSTGTTTPSDCVQYDANGNTIDAGAPCGGGIPSTTPLSAKFPIYNGVLADGITPTSFVNGDLQYKTGLSIGNEIETTNSSLALSTTGSGATQLTVGNAGSTSRASGIFQNTLGELGFWVDSTHPAEIGSTLPAGFNIDGPVTIGAGFAFGGSAKLELGNGTLASPAYSFSAETGLGFYRHGSAELVVVSGGQPTVELAQNVIVAGARGLGFSNSNGDPDAGFGAIFSHAASDTAGLVTLGTTVGGTDGQFKTMNYLTDTNCSSSGGTCGSASAGSVTIAAAATTVTVATTSVTANSQIFIQEDSSLGTKLSVTCNTTIARTYAVTTRTAGTSFVITASAAPAANPACLSYFIVN